MSPQPPAPAPDTVYAAQHDELHADGAHGRLRIRVDDGIVFVRRPGVPGAEGWQAAPLPWVMALFAAESPAATFLRHHGAQPLRQLLVETGTGTSSAPDGAAGGEA